MPLHGLFDENNCIEIEQKIEDEIDQFPDQIIIDYKTPTPDEKENEDERIVDLTLCIQSQPPQFKADPSQFSVLRILGQGSFGKVYMVRKESGVKSHMLFAMKVLKKATLKVRDRIRTKMERDILAEIVHPFIVQLHFAFQTEGKLFLVMDLVKGGDLFSRLSKDVMFTEEDVKFYLAEIALALGHLHSCGIVYRDLKPENNIFINTCILLEVDGHVKLTDFGLCKESIFDDTKTYSFCGTVEYMAPEVITRKGHGPAADWWSFAVLMYELMSGTLPFQSRSRRETLNLILTARLPMPKNFSQNAQKLLRLLFRRNPETRLGHKKDIEDIKSQSFFDTIDFDKLYRKEIECPFKPTVCKTVDHNSFFSEAAPFADTPGPKSADPTLFKGFTFVAPLNGEDRKEYISKNFNETTCERFGSLPHRTLNISNEYNIQELIGTGSFSAVYRAVNKVNLQIYAIKVIPSSQHNPSEEIDILMRFSEHPHIVTLRDVFINDGKYFLVMEYLRGGELLTRINKLKSLSEKESAAYFEVITCTISYLHKHGVVHRDLKPSNIMFTDDSGLPETIRIADFGFAKQIRADNGLLMTPCYTANYVAPEVLKQQGYDSGCDIWSLGIILYAMISGTTPYMNDDIEDPSLILQRITQGQINLSSGVWPRASQQVKDLIASMIHLDPSNRPSAKEILNHFWIKNKANHSDIRLQNETWRLKDTMKMMFSAFHKSNDVKILNPNVQNSSILMKRANKKKEKQ